MYSNQNGNGVELAFQPHPLVRNPHFQTIVSTISGPYRSRASVHSVAREVVLRAGEVRLQGYYSPHPDRRSKGLVLVLHGWLGHAASSYVMTIAENLYRCGYSVFRLNLRDHGDSHYLNPGRLYGDLLDETIIATQQIAQLERNRPFYIVGASLGGNFAMRLALSHSWAPLANLAHTIVINPVINPYNATLSLDSAPMIYRAYFRHRWRKFIDKKREFCPTFYEMPDLTTARTYMAMTEMFVHYYTSYSDTTAYFADYTITPEMMVTLRTGVTMIAAADDPMVPISDLSPFKNLTRYLQMHIQPYGGHVGFIDIFPFRKWASEAVRLILEDRPRVTYLKSE